MLSIRLIVLFLVIFFSWTSLASSQCYRFTNLKGYTMRAVEQYKLSEDGFSGQIYEIILDDNPRVIGPGLEDFKFVRTSLFSILGVYNDGSSKNSSITYSIDLRAKKVTYTGTKSGFLLGDGVMIMVGDIVGDCSE